jgi:hypothetical protein
VRLPEQALSRPVPLFPDPASVSSTPAPRVTSAVVCRPCNHSLSPSSRAMSREATFHISVATLLPQGRAHSSPGAAVELPCLKRPEQLCHPPSSAQASCQALVAVEHHEVSSAIGFCRRLSTSLLLAASGSCPVPPSHPRAPPRRPGAL